MGGGTQAEVAVGAETRERLVDAGARLFWRQGYTGTGVKQIVAEAGAPFGSLYHFFPGGKEDLGAAAVRRGGAHYARVVGSVLAAEPDLERAVESAFEAAGRTLVETDYADACPIATVALEVASTSEVMRVACAEVFEGWAEGLVARFTHDGVPPGGARELALTFLALLEGAFVLCRAARSTEAMEAAGRAAVASTREALAAAGRRRAPARTRRR